MVRGDGFDPGQSGIVKGGERQQKKEKREMVGDEMEKDLLLSQDNSI